MKTAARNLSLSYTIEGFQVGYDWWTLELELCVHVSAYDPGSTGGYRDNEIGYPPEGGEVELVSATILHATQHDNQAGEDVEADALRLIRLQSILDGRIETDQALVEELLDYAQDHVD